MRTGAVIERVERVATTRAGADADRWELEARLRDVADLVAWCEASRGELVTRLGEVASFPESTIADIDRCSLGNATKTTERAKTLDAAPAFGQALDDAQITAAHVDVLTRGAKGLDESQRAELFGRADTLADEAAGLTVGQFDKRVKHLVNGILGDSGAEARLERQRRTVGLSTWTDGEGMWCLKGRFDPVTAIRFGPRLDSAVDALFAAGEPPWCPADPVQKQQHLRAIALARLAGVDVTELVGGLDTADGEDSGTDSGSLPPIVTGRPELLGVIHIHTDAAGADRTTTDATCEAETSGSARPDKHPIDPDSVPGLERRVARVDVEWAVPVDVPASILELLATDADIHGIVVRNGVVIHAPGQLDLGRSNRLASPAQRRALRAMYSTCAIPGCTVGFERCKIHHVIWWRHGGRTDLANLIPICAHHHTKVHHHGWDLTLTDSRDLVIRYPDGTVRNTGPPGHHAA